MRRREVLKFAGWLSVTALLALVHVALIFVGLVVGLLVIDSGYFMRYDTAEHEIDWARKVLADTGASVDDWWKDDSP